MLVNMKELLPPAAEGEYAVAGFNVFGYEDARAVIDAAEKLGAPVILMANKDIVRHMKVEYLGPLLASMAADASVPVCVHLDHTYEYGTIIRAMKAGFSSVMFDGSQLPLEENIRRTRGIVEIAGALNVSVEGEIGSVPYDEAGSTIKSQYTEPSEAERFAGETGVDAMAVAVGTIHKQTSQGACIQFDRLAAIEARTRVPLVIHGSSGIIDEEVRRLVKTRVAKLNIGTALRMAFGRSMRADMEADASLFDRLKMFQHAMPEVRKTAEEKILLLGWRG